MPNSRSATQRVRLTEKETACNRGHKNRVKARRKKFAEALKAKDSTTVQSALVELMSVTDKATKSGAMHKRTADRIKSRANLKANAI
jgi:small subunit ribosomal protein S20